MSEKNREGKRSARERLRAEREREAAGARRTRTVKVGGVAVVALAAAAGIGVVAAGGGDEADNGGGSAEPIVVGRTDAPATLTVYEDFRCPACGQFEQTFRDTIHELTDTGSLRVEYHTVSIIDGNIGGDGSKNAANAAACARDAGAFAAYHDTLFAHQPSERDDAFADKDHLIDLAADIEGLDTPVFRDCVEQGTHDSWVNRVNSDFMQSDFNATPTVLLDGEDIYGSDASVALTPDTLRTRVEELAGA
ncbi:thioredoxin domain-containing protein [Streptomyces sp. RFCAC02]|uniref:DsbA family protein n=1 Tax=Streptomyces sp. RFCAC02 TaxID=2499143 RepID=UPI00143D0687|nr:thioredoxin domain-containing protein [Streptomyces sp. RFCAC02]